MYVLNNGSSFSSTQALSAAFADSPSVTLFSVDENLGIAGGRNYLMSKTTEDWLLFVDNDITVDTAGWVTYFTEAVNEYADAEVCIPQLWQLPEKMISQRWHMRIQEGKALIDGGNDQDISNIFPGGASLINRQLFERLGPYDDELFVGYEDYELCIRAELLGAPVRACHVPAVTLTHHHRVVKKSEDKMSLRTRYDLDKLQHSHAHIMKKHNVWVAGDYKQHAVAAIDYMVHGRRMTWKQRVGKYIPRSVKWWLKKVWLA